MTLCLTASLLLRLPSQFPVAVVVPRPLPWTFTDCTLAFSGCLWCSRVEYGIWTPKDSEMPYKSTLQWNRGFLEFCWHWGEYYYRDEHFTKKSTQSSAVKLNKELTQRLGEGETVEFRRGLTKLTPPQTSSWSESAKPNMACGYLEGCFFKNSSRAYSSAQNPEIVDQSCCKSQNPYNTLQSPTMS